jgi:intracellular multiplication protein IcmO
MASKKVIRGVRRSQKVDIQARRDDVRSFWHRLDDNCATTDGTFRVFLTLAIATLVTCWVPFLPEVFFLMAVFVFLRCYGLKNKKWEGPFRLPARLNKLMGRDVIDASTMKPAAANMYGGIDEESGEQVWLSTNDINKHALMIGTTGSGKTENIMGQAFCLLALGSGVLLVDGKASVNTFDSLYKISRILGREEDLFVTDYLTGGRDIQGPQKSKRSHGYNPLGFGGSSQMSETMVSLMDTGDGADMWAGRAISFMEAIMPPLVYLSERGHILLNPSLLADYFLLTNIENLCWFGVFQDLHGRFVNLKADHPQDWIAMEKRLEALRRYLENLPSYGMSKPSRPVRHARMDAQTYADLEAQYRSGGEESSAPNEQSRQKVEEQHGYITMQLVRAVVNLSFNYGYIYNNELSEISFADIMLNRRSLVVLLPSLEKSPENLEQLGKLTILSLKSVLGSLLDTESEGRKREIIDASPSRSKIPFGVVLDEVGYYIVKGLSVIPAQARALGVAVYFGTQDIPSLMKGSEAEGKAILDNTAVKWFGRLTSSEDSDTAKVAREIGGKAHVQVANDMKYQRDAFASHLKVQEGSSLQEVAQIEYDDLVNQENGQFHMVTGSKSIDRRGRETGGARIVRMLAFYTGGIPSVDTWRRNPYVAVKPLTPADGPEVRQREIIRREARAGVHRTLEEMGTRGTRLYEQAKKVDNDPIGKALRAFRQGRLSKEGVADYVAKELARRKSAERELIRKGHMAKLSNGLASVQNQINGSSTAAKDVSQGILDAFLHPEQEVIGKVPVRDSAREAVDAL